MQKAAPGQCPKPLFSDDFGAADQGVRGPAAHEKKMKKKIKEVIVVEGKTDTAIIQKLFDADTIETHGLALTEETLDFIEEMNKTKGVILLTDPDYPGMKIRNMIMKRIPHVKQAFVDKKDAIGKRKLGIAEAREEAIIQALENVVSFSQNTQSISWEEFISLDIIGDKQK